MANHLFNYLSVGTKTLEQRAVHVRVSQQTEESDNCLDMEAQDSQLVKA